MWFQSSWQFIGHGWTQLSSASNNPWVLKLFVCVVLVDFFFILPSTWSPKVLRTFATVCTSRIDSYKSECDKAYHIEVQRLWGLYSNARPLVLASPGSDSVHGPSCWSVTMHAYAMARHIFHRDKNHQSYAPRHFFLSKHVSDQSYHTTNCPARKRHSRVRLIYDAFIRQHEFFSDQEAPHVGNWPNRLSQPPVDDEISKNDGHASRSTVNRVIVSLNRDNGSHDLCASSQPRNSIATESAVP